MPVYNHQIEVNVPIHTVWNFVSNMNNWAPLVPGYIDHKIISDTESTWCFKSDIGFMKKKIELKVDITSWEEPHKVTFNLKGINEKFSGHGFFSAEESGKSKVLMTGCLDITAEGLMAKVANSILTSSLPETTSELTEAVAAKIEEYALH
ncbi:CoxG family protein [Bacillus sp. S/N-304-OC-R1]|uniref:CoxG family protein n=1 Tax=Bacillus sp. S/N-304-OC-R1 TaxID=2758034 RepID=UPI001C8F09FC|nr:SRPBCC family protein [Bacillus sp. S/N-304-OC-R1]MBY0123020.1 SRPBCC family protein [Bacillus sp. S/N-304-OC-R1]